MFPRIVVSLANDSRGIFFASPKTRGELDILLNRSSLCLEGDSTLSVGRARHFLMKSTPLAALLAFDAQDAHTLLEWSSSSITLIPKSSKTSTNFLLVTPSRFGSINKFSVDT